MDCLRAIPKSHRLCEDFLELEDSSTAKTLGLRWQAQADLFLFSPPNIPLQETYTKRSVLSQIAKLFDPAGWLAPFVIRAKIFMQALWLRDLDWDQPLPGDLLTQWQEFLLSFSSLRDIRVPRWVHFQPRATIQFHGFCDASERAYGAAVYLRVELGNQIFVNLLSAKTRVAPIKSISIPRLELCGAVLLTDLCSVLLPASPAVSFQSFYWTDSTIVLAWLNKPACNWTTFVANRISKITELTNPGDWHHVSSEHNPADLASRGAHPQELLSNPLWFHGPDWLRLSQSHWPIIPVLSLEIALEKKASKSHAATLTPPAEFISRFSELHRALRVTAWMFRFINRCRRSAPPPSQELSADELHFIQSRFISLSQNRIYSNEISCLRAQKQLPASSSLRNLNPFLDSKGILRACGRIRTSASLSYDERHPIILPSSCSFTKLLVRFTHRISLHGGNQLIVRLIRSQFWIPKLKVLIKSVINSCKSCVVYRKRLQTQMMGDLPADRTTFTRPFTVVGVDFAGPFDVKNYAGRACLITKGYVCVFVCFSTKAIHLEATSDLTTEKFLAAFSRLVARRGCPQKIYSDNGKTFVGAAKTLSRDFVESLRSEVLAKHSLHSLSWHFNPPSAPHMGGLWESGVKSFKALFYKSTATSKYTFEELSTLLARIEACLNSRPIAPMSEDSTDFQALTPGHFLVGGPLITITEPRITQDAMSILNRWQRLKALHQQFCFRWKEEYLKELHKRNKWQFAQRDLKVGDMVIVKDDNVAINEWRLGRVHLTHPGDDGKVRVADILTSRGIVRRPVHKLVILPTDDNTAVMSN
ncbi:uncharacterized protein LOC122757848 [Drosophila mojavensis]|uniref:uncharacterized protein LOC122757848 n=1 Tax=Drosophila mojavensis TaxID=7230 RepID=UPI001CD16D95|nr:uncharacterized protein LOC122757848 [Drosophila mojavensis]